MKVASRPGVLVEVRMGMRVRREVRGEKGPGRWVGGWWVGRKPRWRETVKGGVWGEGVGGRVWRRGKVGGVGLGAIVRVFVLWGEGSGRVGRLGWRMDDGGFGKGGWMTGILFLCCVYSFCGRKGFRPFPSFFFCWDLGFGSGLEALREIADCDKEGSVFFFLYSRSNCGRRMAYQTFFLVSPLRLGLSFSEEIVFGSIEKRLPIKCKNPFGRIDSL